MTVSIKQPKTPITRDLLLTRNIFSRQQIRTNKSSIQPPVVKPEQPVKNNKVPVSKSSRTIKSHMPNTNAIPTIQSSILNKKQIIQPLEKNELKKSSVVKISPSVNVSKYVNLSK